jgi:hypothetical protein
LKVLKNSILIVERSTLRNNGRLPGFQTPLSTVEFAIHSRRGFVTNPTVNIGNSTLYDNTNGVFSDGILTFITHTTVANNNKLGLRFLRDLDALGQVQLTVIQSVIHGHNSDCNGLDPADAEYDLDFNINASSDESCGFTGFNDFQNIANPFFGGLADHGGPTPTLMPRSNSVLVDPIGGGCGSLTDDQHGQPRPIDGDDVSGALCDIGAVEFNPAMEPELFKTVTGLTVEDLHLLVRLKVFNTEQTNQGVFAFRRYEDASARNAGIDNHEDSSHYGLYDTVVAREQESPYHPGT